MEEGAESAMGFAVLVIGKDFGGAPSDVGRIAVKFLVNDSQMSFNLYHEGLKILFYGPVNN